ncbi:MAG: hypothetical protein AB2L09_01545 [Coriobacteriia bacterium]
MGLFDRFHGKQRESQEAIDVETVARELLEPSSFSFVVFDGDCQSDMPQLLEACGYKLLRAGTATGTPSYLHVNLGRVSGADPTVVLKAHRSTPAMTVLFDPEMLIPTLHERELADFCHSRSTSAKAALWEPLSETAALMEFTSEGICRQTWCQGGRPTDEQRNPHPEILSLPNDQGIRSALKAAGIAVDSLFSPAQVRVVELREYV